MPQLGSHYLTVYTKGGGSNTWTFNITEPEDLDSEDPFNGTYSTKLTLIELKSLPNLPLVKLMR